MTRYVGIPMAVLLVLSACSGESNDCSTPGEQRCTKNALQTCARNFLGGSPYWSSDAACPSPQVCRVDTAGPSVNLGGENGCFDPKAFCPYEGYATCTGWWSTQSPLWSCVLRASDQTLQWSVTNCGELATRAMCEGNTPPYLPPAACYEVVENCPLFPIPNIHCEGNVLFSCNWQLIDDKVVANWVTQDCTLSGQVCRLLPLYAVPECTFP